MGATCNARRAGERRRDAGNSAWREGRLVSSGSGRGAPPKGGRAGSDVEVLEGNRRRGTGGRLAATLRPPVPLPLPLSHSLANPPHGFTSTLHNCHPFVPRPPSNWLPASPPAADSTHAAVHLADRLPAACPHPASWQTWQTLLPARLTSLRLTTHHL